LARLAKGVIQNFNYFVIHSRILQSQKRPTKRAADFWESAASRSIFLASSFFCSQALSQPAQNPLTQTVGTPLAWQSKKKKSYHV